ncbi:MAG: integral rane sensor signal transduction histidine kinase, partial [Clostridiales bacterium]|nr:integral rane sensor signal transduction histidine kinase [Clostridiales bacterium]
LLRVVSKGTEELITIRDELCYVESFVNIQKYKNINTFSVLYEVEEEVLNCKILKLLLQPIVENAIIHGIEAVNYDGIISIKLYEDQSKIKIIVTDNGIGMTREQIEASFKGEENLQQNRFSSIGIGNVNERIKLYFGDEYGIKIISEPSMFTNVEISIPKIEEDELQDVKNINS